MMTDAPGDEPSLDIESGLWLPVSEIARLKDKSRQAISKRVKALVDDGHITTRPGPNGTVLVNLAAFDRAVGEVGDVAKEQSAETRADNDRDESNSSSGSNPRFRDAATREKEYSADIKFLDREERLKRLIPVADLEDAAAKAAEEIIRIVDRLPAENERVSGAVGKDGPSGARTVLKEIARELREKIADAMKTLAGAAGGATLDTSFQPLALGDETDDQ